MEDNYVELAQFLDTQIAPGVSNRDVLTALKKLEDSEPSGFIQRVVRFVRGKEPQTALTVAEELTPSPDVKFLDGVYNSLDLMSLEKLVNVGYDGENYFFRTLPLARSFVKYGDSQCEFSDAAEVDPEALTELDNQEKFGHCPFSN